MKRSLIFCAIALVAVAVNTASAAVNVQLNLQYTDPADESQGGTWELLAGSDAGGIAGIAVLIDNINDDASAGDVNFEEFKSQPIGTVIEIVTGSDLDGTLILDAGLGAGTTGNVADDLFPGNSPAIWANNASLAIGTFGAVRPSFVASAGTQNEGVNEFSGTTAVETTFGTQSVRGDGVATDGLLPGDANRDGNVDGNDFSILALNFNGPGGWDEGNFDSSPNVDGNDFSALALNFNQSATAPAVGAVSSVPEPSSILLVSMVAAMAAGMRRRS